MSERANEERYGLYQFRDGELKALAYAPSPMGLGLALVTLAREGDIDPAVRLGVRDRSAGEWLVFPWRDARGVSR